MSFLGEAFSVAATAAPPAASALAAAPTPEPDSALVFGLKLFGTGALLVATAAYLSHRIAERDARNSPSKEDTDG